MVIRLALWSITAGLLASVGPADARPPVCGVIEEGATPDDRGLDTAAFARAVAACAGRGGRVEVPAGVYRLAQLRLGSDMELHLAPGAVLRATTSLDDYPPVAALGGDRAFLYAVGAHDLTIGGTGVIDGSGPAWWASVRLPGYRDVELAPDADERRIRFGLILQGCSNARVRDITIRDTPMYLMALRDCRGVVVDGVTLSAPVDSPNTDGLQIIDSSDVTVSDCDIAVGDDGIVTKARNRIIERLKVTGCRIRSDDGAIKFGTRSSSGVCDSVFSDIVIDESRYGIALFMIQGGTYENVRFRDMRIRTGGRHARHYPIFVDIDDRAGLGRVQAISFDGLDITTAGNILIAGHPKAPVRDVSLSNIRMRVAGAQDLPRTSSKPFGNRKFKPLPGSADHSRVDAQIVLGHVDGARLRHIDVTGDRRAAVLATPGSTNVSAEWAR